MAILAKLDALVLVASCVHVPVDVVSQQQRSEDHIVQAQLKRLGAEVMYHAKEVHGVLTHWQSEAQQLPLRR